MERIIDRALKQYGMEGMRRDVIRKKKIQS